MKNQSANGADVVSVAGAIELSKERGEAIINVANADSCHEQHSGRTMASAVIVNVMIQALLLKK